MRACWMISQRSPELCVIKDIIALHEEAYDRAEAIFTEAATICTAINSPFELAPTLGHLAEIALVQQHYSRAQQLGEQAVQLLRIAQEKINWPVRSAVWRKHISIKVNSP